MQSTLSVPGWYRADRFRKWLLACTLVAGALLFASVVPASRVQATGGDFRSINFVAAAPYTYDHAVGGGAFDDGTVGDYADIVNQLEGGRFSCYDIVTFLAAIEMNATTIDAVQTGEFDFRFLANTTGQQGAAIADVLRVQVNYGSVVGGDGPGGRDSGIRDDGGSQATLVREQLNGPLYGASSTLLATVRVTDLEAGERVIVRIDTRLACKPNSNPTGNLQASSEAARVYGTNEAISVGQQTIPFLRIADVAGTGEPLLALSKSVVETNSPCSDSRESIATYQFESVKYCYVVTNFGTQPLLDVFLLDDNATPSVANDDFVVTLSSLANLDGQGDRPDLAAGESAIGEKRLSFNSTGSYVNTARATGNNGLSGSNYKELVQTDTAEAIVQAIPTELTWASHSMTVAYEDLKNTGWSDWDYNDLVVRLQISKGVNYKGNLAELVVDYEAEARGADFNHSFIHKLPLYGGGSAELVVWDAAGREIRRQTNNFGSLASFTVFERTRDALAPLDGFFDTNTRLSQPSAVPGHKARLSISLSMPNANPVAALPPEPWDPYIYVYNTGEEVHLLIPGQLNNTQTVNSAFDSESPLLGFDLPLAQVFDSQWDWPIEFAGLWRAYPAYVNYLGSGGTRNQDWHTAQRADSRWQWDESKLGGRSTYLSASSEGTTALSRYFARPIADDLDNDGRPEIVIGNLLANRLEVVGPLRQPLPGWPQSVGGGIKGAAAISDLDGDLDKEIVVGAEDGWLYAWHHDGTRVAGWPIMIDESFRILAQPAVGDLDSDGKPDVIVPVSNGKVYAFDASGQALQGWPASIGDVKDQYNSQLINSSPSIADLNGDGHNEVVVGSTDRRLYAFNGDGSVRWSFATGDMVFSSPVVGDVDQSLPGLEIAFGSGDSYFYLLDKDGQLLWRRPTGWTLRSSPIRADLDQDGDIELLIGGDDDKLWAWHHDGQIVEGWPQQAAADLFSSIAIGDIDGDLDPEVVIGSEDAHVYAWHADGTLVADWPRPTSLSVKGGPTLANLDTDPSLEIIAADFGGNLYTWNVSSYNLFVPILGSQ